MPKPAPWAAPNGISEESFAIDPPRPKQRANGSVSGSVECIPIDRIKQGRKIFSARFLARFLARFFVSIFQRLKAFAQTRRTQAGDNYMKRLRPDSSPLRYSPAAARFAPLARLAGDGCVAMDSLRPAIPSLSPRHFELVHHLFLEESPRLRRAIRLCLN